MIEILHLDIGEFIRLIWANIEAEDFLLREYLGTFMPSVVLSFGFQSAAQYQ